MVDGGSLRLVTTSPRLDPWAALLDSYLEAVPRSGPPSRYARAVERAARAVDAAAALSRWCATAPDQLTARQITEWLDRPGPRPYSVKVERAAVTAVLEHGVTLGMLAAHPLKALGAWDELLTRFAGEHDASRSSVDSHQRRAARFARWAGVAPADVDRELLVRYLAQPGWADWTRKSARVSLRLVLGFAADVGLLPDNPARLLPLETAGAHRPYEQLATAAAAAFDHGGETVRIDAAALPQHPCWDWAEATGRPYSPGKANGRPPADLLAEWQTAGSPVVTFLDDPVTAAWDRLLVSYAVAAAAGGRMTSSVRVRYSHLRAFARWAGLAPVDVDEAVLVRYLGNPGWKPESRRSVRSSFRVVFRHAYKAGMLAADPSVELDGVRVPSSSPRPTPEAALSAALAGIRPRTRLMLLLGALAGLRRAEIACLRVDAITEDGLRVIGKGGKVRMVPIHPALGPELVSYLANTGIRAGYLFPGETDGHLSAHHVGKLLAHALPDQWTAHSLRHRFSSRSYAGCFDIRALQELLGHASPAVTARYVAVPNTALVNAVAAVPPVAGMGAPPPLPDDDQGAAAAPSAVAPSSSDASPPAAAEDDDWDPWAAWSAEQDR